MRPSGVALLDEVLGGFAPVMPVVLAGPTGAGRTLLCLQLAAAYAGRGETVAFLTLEPPALLLRQSASLGLDLEPAVREGRLAFLELDAGAASAVRVHGIERLVEALRAEVPRARVLIIDPITALTSELADEARHRALLHRLFETCAEAGQIAVVTAESERLREDPALARVLEGLCGAYVELARTPLGGRVLSVTKSRSGTEAQGAVEFVIGRGGALRQQPSARPARGAATPAPPRPPPPPASPAASGEEAERPTVLLVEDEPGTREQIGDWLRPRYTVIAAADGFEAMSAVLSHRPALVVLDLVLPRVSGFEVIRALRSAGAGMPVLVVSGYLARSGDRVRVLVLGATDLLAKPVQRFELLQKVETLLRLPPAAPPDLDSADVDRLLFSQSATRVLSEEEFRDRLDRACRFGERFGLASALVFVEAPSADALDAVLAAADETLRLEDAVVSISKRRAAVLLVATEVDNAPRALERVAARVGSNGGSITGLRWRAGPAQPLGPRGWKESFSDLRAWPKRKRR